MDNYNAITLEALDSYFKVLEYVGHVSDVDTNKLMLLLYLLDFTLKYEYYITEKDYEVIDSIMNCLAETTCFISHICHQELSRSHSFISQPLAGYMRNVPIKITLVDDIRHTEDKESLRLVNL